MSNYDTHDPNNTPDDNGWDGEYPKCQGCGELCRDCPERFTDADHELLDRLFEGMTDDEIAEWASKEVGDEDIPF